VVVATVTAAWAAWTSSPRLHPLPKDREPHPEGAALFLCPDAGYNEVMAFKPSTGFMRVLLLLAIFSLAPVTMYLLYSRTGGPPSQKEMGFQKNLRYAFMQGGDAVDIAPLAAWPYVKVCALDAGLSTAEVNEILGFDYEFIQELHWLHLADFWSLVFIDAEREANWGLTRPVTPVRISRKDLADLNLPAGAKGQCITRDGRIEITRRGVPVGESPIVVQLVDARRE